MASANCMSLSRKHAGDVGGVAADLSTGEEGLVEANMGSPKSSNSYSSENDSSGISLSGTAAASAVSSKSSSSDRSASDMSSSSAAG